MQAIDPLLAPARPEVSILIAARNEEHTILNCLRAIVALQYPTESLEILIGNDQSTDRTASVVADFIADRPGFRLIEIVESGTPGLTGKANVLAQLSRHARGQWLFFTDADTVVPPQWVAALRTCFTGNVGIVSGVTLPVGNRPFHHLQTIDWLYNLTLTHGLGRLKLPVTAMGNNMAVSRDAYDAVGGYETLPFSIVEDYALFRAVVGAGYGFANRLDRQTLARTQPVETLLQLLNQRKRWMRGATQLPVWIVAGLYAQYLVGPLFMLLALWLPTLAAGLYVARLLVQTVVILLGLGRLGQTKLWPYALLFEVYQLIIGPLAVLYYVLPTRIDWKGRRYA